MRTAKAQISPRTLISAFVIRCLDSIISVVSICEISRLASLRSWAGQFESYLVANPEDRFTRDVAHLIPYNKFYCLEKFN